MCYELGLGVSPNASKAEEYRRRAARAVAQAAKSDAGHSAESARAVPEQLAAGGAASDDAAASNPSSSQVLAPQSRLQQRNACAEHFAKHHYLDHHQHISDGFYDAGRARCASLSLAELMRSPSGVKVEREVILISDADAALRQCVAAAQQRLSTVCSSAAGMPELARCDVFDLVADSEACLCGVFGLGLHLVVVVRGPLFAGFSGRQHRVCRAALRSW